MIALTPQHVTREPAMNSAQKPHDGAAGQRGKRQKPSGRCPGFILDVCEASNSFALHVPSNPAIVAVSSAAYSTHSAIASATAGEEADSTTRWRYRNCLQREARIIANEKANGDELNEQRGPTLELSRIPKLCAKERCEGTHTWSIVEKGPTLSLRRGWKQLSTRWDDRGRCRCQGERSPSLRL